MVGGLRDTVVFVGSVLEMSTGVCGGSVVWVVSYRWGVGEGVERGRGGEGPFVVNSWVMLFKSSSVSLDCRLLFLFSLACLCSSEQVLPGDWAYEVVPLP